jgi:hypothetical protein
MKRSLGLLSALVFGMLVTVPDTSYAACTSEYVPEANMCFVQFDDGSTEVLGPLLSPFEIALCLEFCAPRDVDPWDPKNQFQRHPSALPGIAGQNPGILTPGPKPLPELTSDTIFMFQ